MSDVSSQTGAAKQRPLSPHLMIYKPIPTMVMSILHRMTGVGLYFGTALVAWWLMAAASGPGAFETASSFFGSWFGRLVLFGYTFVLVHHMLGGIKHLVQDTGAALEKTFTTKMAVAQPIVAFVITLVIWGVAYGIR
ncbi:MAG: succinate dehydrogenase, cytochrome b556 subunit [Pseudomonadota bacterium]